MGLGFHDREALYGRINRRVDVMLEKGLLEEARGFFQKGPGATAVQAIGYKELAPYFRGEIPLEAAAENIRRETRRYAKRQLTWFRRNPGVRWLLWEKTLDLEDARQKATAYMEEFGL